MRHGLRRLLSIVAVLGCGVASVACEDDPDDLEYLRVRGGSGGAASGQSGAGGQGSGGTTAREDVDAG